MSFTSVWTWVIILAVVLILFARPGKISGIMGDIGKGLRKFKEGTKSPDDEGKTSTEMQTLEATPARRPVGRPPASGKRPVGRPPGRKTSPVKKSGTRKRRTRNSDTEVARWTAEYPRLQTEHKTKSSIIRHLTDEGLTTVEISRVMELRYQHVRNVQLKPLKRKKKTA